MSKMTDKQLDELIDALPNEMAASPSVWQRVQQEIDAKPIRKAPQLLPWALIASVVLTAILSWKLFDHESLMLKPESKSSAILALIDNIERSHQQQVSQLQQSMQLVAWRENPEFSPFKKGLGELRQAMIEVIKQLKQQPQDKQLWDLWLWMQQQELNLLGQEQQVQQIESI
ncbi:hypothetical protein [Parashewanella tropica]|uniref:hypothetical protein n=1 Tax=Parashewanella tropica TaxID=2547970 RepID=UPI0010598F8B|nr:hypothetical protein [Parashewanella tropica]